MRIIWLIAIAFCTTGVAGAQAVLAPWGLTWGQSKAEVEALGVTLVECEMKDDTEVCNAATLPDGLPGADFFRLRFRNGQELVAATFASATIHDDRDGEKGKALYEELRAGVVADYGEGIRDETADVLLGFYDCLNTEGCGQWRSAWSGTDVQLSLRAIKSDEGYVMLNYYRPN